MEACLCCCTGSGCCTGWSPYSCPEHMGPSEHVLMNEWGSSTCLSLCLEFTARGGGVGVSAYCGLLCPGDHWRMGLTAFHIVQPTPREQGSGPPPPLWFPLLSLGAWGSVWWASVQAPTESPAQLVAWLRVPADLTRAPARNRPHFFEALTVPWDSAFPSIRNW